MVQFSNGSISLDHFIILHTFTHFFTVLKGGCSTGGETGCKPVLLPFENWTVKTSGFQMFPVFEGSDFGSPLYYYV